MGGNSTNEYLEFKENLSNKLSWNFYWTITPNQNCSFLGHESIVRLLIERGANIHATNIINYTPYHNAAGEGARTFPITDNRLFRWHGDNYWFCFASGKENVLKLLIEKGANVNSMADILWPPINLAANKGK